MGRRDGRVIVPADEGVGDFSSYGGATAVVPQARRLIAPTTEFHDGSERDALVEEVSGAPGAKAMAAIVPWVEPESDEVAPQRSEQHVFRITALGVHTSRRGGSLALVDELRERERVRLSP